MRPLNLCRETIQIEVTVVDKKSRVPKEEKMVKEIGFWNSQGGGKDKLFFFPADSLVLVT